MRRHSALAIGVLMLAGIGAAFWLRPTLDISEIKRTALRYRQQGNLDAFIAVLEKVPASSPDKARAYLEQGRAYWELARARPMEQVLQKCITLETNPELATDETLGAWGTLGDHYVGQERFDEARDVIWKVLDVRSRRGNPDPFYLILLLRLRFESAEPAVAIKHLNAFLANDPLDYDSHRALGIYLARVGKLEESREHLEFALEANSSVPRFVESWLWYLFHINDMDTATKVLDQLPAEGDRYPQFWVYRGKAADFRGDVDSAIRNFRRALELEPRRIDANHLLSQALRKARKSQEFEDCVRLCQELGRAFRELAGIYTVLRNQDPPAPDASTCRQISKLCAELGWERDARAWTLVGDTVSSEEHPSSTHRRLTDR